MACLLLIIVGAVFNFLTRPPSFRLEDGTVLQLTVAKVGYTNQFKHGTPIEKVLGNLIGTNGWGLGKWKLTQADTLYFPSGTDASALTLQFRLVGASNAVVKTELFRPPAFHRKYRILHWGQDKFRYVGELNESAFLKRRDGYFGYFHTRAFARTSPRLFLEIQGRDDERGPWKRVAWFEFQNPEIASVQPWSPLPFPITNQFGPLTAVLGPVQVQEPRDNVTPYPDIWQHAVEIPFKFITGGQIVTNWSVEQMRAVDASGNYSHLGAFRSVTNEWVIYRAWLSADPSVPWKITGHFVQDAEFSGTNIFSLQLPFPIRTAIETNIGGLPTTIQAVNSDMLSMDIPRTIKDRRIVFVEAVNESGESLHTGTGSWHQHGFWKSLDTSKIKSNFTARVAISANIPFEYLLQPRTRSPDLATTPSVVVPSIEPFTIGFLSIAFGG